MITRNQKANPLLVRNMQAAAKVTAECRKLKRLNKVPISTAADGNAKRKRENKEDVASTEESDSADDSVDVEAEDLGASHHTTSRCDRHTCACTLLTFPLDVLLWCVNMG
jgi:hypothetical protein